MKETSSSGGGGGGAGRFRQQFEDVVRRRLSNPVQQSSSRLVGKLLDKTITLGTLTKETLASPMLKFRRSTGGGGPGAASSSQHQLSRISELDLTTSCSTSFASTPKSSMLSASSQSVRASTSTPVQLNRPLQQLCPSQTTTTTSTKTPNGGKRLKTREVIFSMDYLNRSFDGVETMPSDGEDNHNDHDDVDDCDDDDDDEVDDVDVFDVGGEEGEEEEDEKLANYRKLITEMNRTFEEKFARSNAAAVAANADTDTTDATTDNNQKRNEQVLKKLDVKGEIFDFFSVFLFAFFKF